MEGKNRPFKPNGGEKDLYTYWPFAYQKMKAKRVSETLEKGNKRI